MYRMLLVLLIMVLNIGCDSSTTPDSDPGAKWTGEQITTVYITLVDGTDTVRATWEDLDGIGGNPANRLDTLTLKLGKTYTGKFQILSMVNGTLVDITSTLIDSAAHYELLLFATDSGSIVNFTKTDKDTNGVLTGMAITVEPNYIGMQKCGIRLRHYDKVADKKIGSGSSVNLAIDFQVKVEA